MNSKSLFVIILLLSTLIFPCVSGNLNFLEKSQVINNENPLSNNFRTEVVFCYGKISGLFEMGGAYHVNYAYGFNAEDVICIINYTDKPLYHHLTGGIKCSIDRTPIFWMSLHGTVSDDFIYASYGFLSPKILLLLYYIQKS